MDPNVGCKVPDQEEYDQLAAERDYAIARAKCLETKLNNLVGLCRQLDVEEAVKMYYDRFGNSAPPKLLRSAIAEVRVLLGEKP